MMKNIHINRKRIYLLLTLIILLAVAAGCSEEKADATHGAAPPPPTVTVSLPVEQSITQYAEFTGTTEALESVTIRARVEGYLENIHFKPGDRVNTGDLLFSIDDETYQTLLEQANADLAIRNAELDVAEATSLRRENAYKDKAVSEVAVIEARATLSTAKAAIEASKAAVKQARLDLSYTKVKAPISGRIGRNLVDVGNLVGATERTALTSIVNNDFIYVYFTVNERDLLKYYQQDKTLPSPANIGTQIFFGLATQKAFPYQGQIDYVHNRMDAGTGTIRVRGIFPNPDHELLPGLFARVQVPVANAADVLLVPETALGRDQQGDFLLKTDSENMVQYQPVTTGILVNGMRVIIRGITKEDRIIINGLQKAYPGAPVTPVEEQSSTEDSTESAETPA